MIQLPTYIIGEEHRSREMEEPLVRAIRVLFDRTVAAGWSTEEVPKGMEEPVRNHRHDNSADSDLADNLEHQGPRRTADRLIEGFVNAQDIGP